MPILVDRGWVDSDWHISKNYVKNINGIQTIKGILYKGDKINKLTHLNDSQSDKLFTVNPSEIAERLNLPNKDISGKFIVKLVDFTENNPNVMPQPILKSELMTWTIMPDKHQSYANFWLFVTVANITSNLYVWFI